MSEALVSTNRLRELRSGLGSGESPILLVVHDYPDPDSIASALAAQTLVRSWGVDSTIVHGGLIGREENAEMVRLLEIDLKTFDSLGNLENYRGALFLDTQPQARNQSLPPNITILGVLDHHFTDAPIHSLPPRKGSGNTASHVYLDIRSGLSANSTLVLGYLEAAGIIPDQRLATALLVGVMTDTDGLLRDAAPADVEAYTRLLRLADLNLASRIVHTQLSREYFRFLHLAMIKSTVHGPALFCDCGEVKTPDLLSTASDFLIGLKRIEYALAVGFKDGRAYLSLRAYTPRNDATRVLLSVVEPEGRGGGHNLSAGGSLELGGDREQSLEIIRSRFLAAVDGSDGQKESFI
ncbi:MAG: hypothetical protein FWG74_04185 [Planctomycetes bacterium]|nr:hypothetical protein [Planctomycetota bacterium]